MDKRTFLKTSTLLASGAILTKFQGCTPADNKEHLKNWAGNLEFSTGNVYYPKNIDEVKDVVKKCKKLRALGSMHSFNTIADSNENLLSSRDLNKIILLDPSTNTVKVEAGMRYGELAPYLYEKGFALHNLASLPHISIAGSIATATHGSGINNGNLSTGISAIEFVNAAGDLVSLSRKNDGEIFNGAVVALGALGIVTSVTLDLQPTFNMKQLVYRNLPMSALKDNFEKIEAAGYSVSLFTNWKDKNINQVWIKSRVDSNEPSSIPEDFFGAKAATKDMHPVEDQSSENCTPQMGVPGPWFERMPHFKMGFKPSTGKELQAEYFVPIEHAYDAIMAMETLHEQITPHLFISELRTIKADDLWMSTCYKRGALSLHTTWKQEIPEVMKLLPLVEEKLAPFQPRPHWAKLFTITPKILQSQYEKLDDFKKLVSQHDPEGKFRNEFLDRNLYGS